ncbi:hypothetical protein PR048_010413 [Dryococelus australis]|uniref:Uncharacterized protein n=1 Tax=Dryococelus australis TaxID=614101 RepID=A0ABQ9I3R9_9NEOP|nr:hypothetical protein PR048_010413 [Dryococelus australis]
MACAKCGRVRNIGTEGAAVGERSCFNITKANGSRALRGNSSYLDHHENTYRPYITTTAGCVLLETKRNHFWQPLLANCQSPITTRLPSKRTGFDFRQGRFRILACVNRAGRSRWLVGFLGDLPLPPPLHSCAAPYTPSFAFIGSQDLDIKSRPNLFTHSSSRRRNLIGIQAVECWDTEIGCAQPARSVYLGFSLMFRARTLVTDVAQQKSPATCSPLPTPHSPHHSESLFIPATSSLASRRQRGRWRRSMYLSDAGTGTACSKAHTIDQVDRSRWLRTTNLRVPTLNCFSGNTTNKNGVDWIGGLLSQEIEQKATKTLRCCELSSNIWAALKIEVSRADEGEVSMGQRCWNERAGKRERSPWKPADQPHRPTRFPRTQIREQSAGNITRSSQVFNPSGAAQDFGKQVSAQRRQTLAEQVQVKHKDCPPSKIACGGQHGQAVSGRTAVSAHRSRQATSLHQEG